MGRRVVLDMAIGQRGCLRADKQPLRRIISAVGATGGDVRQKQRLEALVLPSNTALIGGAGLFGVIHVVFFFL